MESSDATANTSRYGKLNVFDTGFSESSVGHKGQKSVLPSQISEIRESYESLIPTFISFGPELKENLAAAHSQSCFRWTGQMSYGPDTQIKVQTLKNNCLHTSSLRVGIETSPNSGEFYKTSEIYLSFVQL